MSQVFELETDEMKRLKDWFAELSSQERRRTQRGPASRLVAYYWDGDAPVAHRIRNISPAGLYLITEQRWYPGTLVTMTLQEPGAHRASAGRSVRVIAKVVWSGKDGVGFAFIFQKPQSAQEKVKSEPADKKSFEEFLKRIRETRGQSLIEYVLVLPMVLLLIVNAVNFAGFFFAWISVANASRAGADYAAMAGASVLAPHEAGGSGIVSLVTQDMSSLPNVSTLTVNVCQNNNGTIKTLAGSCSAVPADPEPASFVLTTVDVTYNYTPFISANFKFPGMNVYATIPPTSISRRAVIRTVQ